MSACITVKQGRWLLARNQTDNLLDFVCKLLKDALFLIRAFHLKNLQLQCVLSPWAVDGCVQATSQPVGASHSGVYAGRELQEWRMAVERLLASLHSPNKHKHKATNQRCLQVRGGKWRHGQCGLGAKRKAVHVTVLHKRLWADRR